MSFTHISYCILTAWSLGLVVFDDDDDDWLTDISIGFGADDGDDQLLSGIDMVDDDGDTIEGVEWTST